MYKATLPLTDQDKQFFEETGYLYIKDFYPDALFRELLFDIHRLINLLRDREEMPLVEAFDVDEFDSGLADLLEKDRKFGGIIYDAVKKIPSHIQLASHQIHSDICRKLLAAEFPGFASRGWGLRLDHPSEDGFLTQLHQDYVSQLCSPRGLVFWTPLRRTDMRLGPVVVYPQSHKRGVFPIEVKGGGSYGLQIHNQDQIEREFEPITPEVERGDCLVVDCLTLHKSSPNRGDRTRWALITRYFDFNDPTGRSIGWIGGLQEGNAFDSVFPELIRQER